MRFPFLAPLCAPFYRLTHGRNRLTSNLATANRENEAYSMVYYCKVLTKG
jgi:hypothetical protein